MCGAGGIKGVVLKGDIELLTELIEMKTQPRKLNLNCFVDEVSHAIIIHKLSHRLEQQFIIFLCQLRYKMKPLSCSR